MNEDQEAYDVTEITAIVRRADEVFQRVGGSSRHWVRDCFLPMLLDSGWALVRLKRTESGEAPDAVDPAGQSEVQPSTRD